MTRASRFDLLVAIATALTTAISFAVAIMTPPKAGPFCVADCIGYPYSDFAAFVPRDFLWMYPALLVAPLLVLMLSGIHERAAGEGRRFALLAMLFSLGAAVTLTADYLIQLRVTQPAVLKAELAGLALLSQYNPRGVFIALEEAGYLLMGIAFAFAAPALPAGRGSRPLRWIFGGGAVLLFVLFVGMSVAYGFDIEYRFEVVAISIDWIVLILAGAMLARNYAIEQTAAAISRDDGR
jgi:uncharacterized membrane protein